jgi:hypothetical protein
MNRKTLQSYGILFVPAILICDDLVFSPLHLQTFLLLKYKKSPICTIELSFSQKMKKEISKLVVYVGLTN